MTVCPQAGLKRRDAPWSPCRYSAAGRGGAPQSAEAVTEPMASPGGLHSLLVWLLLLQPWLTEASENGSATPLPPPAPLGGRMKDHTAVQPPPRGTSEVPKLAEFSLGDSALGVRRGGLRRQGGSCRSPGAWEEWGLNERSPAAEPDAGVRLVRIQGLRIWKRYPGALETWPSWLSRRLPGVRACFSEVLLATLPSPQRAAKCS